jgi:bloom syndrome protein
MTQSERNRVSTDLKAKAPNTKLLYVTPELIATAGFLSTLYSLDNRGLLSSVAVDEVRLT